MTDEDRFRQALVNIYELADGRRHYDGTDDYNCFDAFGDVRRLAAEALSTCPAGCGPKEVVHEGSCGSFDPLLSPFEPLLSTFQTLVDGTEIRFDYTNWKGEQAQRHATVKRIWWGTTKWHPDAQWLFDGWDWGKAGDRTFALKDMTNVEST